MLCGAIPGLGVVRLKPGLSSAHFGHRILRQRVDARHRANTTSGGWQLGRAIPEGNQAVEGLLQFKSHAMQSPALTITWFLSKCRWIAVRETKK